MRMNNILTACCLWAVCAITLADAAHAFEVSSLPVPFFTSGLDIHTATVRRDPNKLLVLFGRPEKIDHVWKPLAANLVDFQKQPEIDMSFQFAPESLTPFLMLAQQALSYTIMKNMQDVAAVDFTKVTSWSFQTIPALASIVINPADVLVFDLKETGAYAALKFRPSIGINPPEIDVRVVPEPGTLLLFGAGVIGLFGWMRRRGHCRKIVVFLLVFGVAWLVIPTYLYAQTNIDCNAPTIQSKGSGNFNDPATWNQGRLPGMNDILLIQANHQITTNVTQIAVRGVCNDGILMGDWATGQMEILADFVVNGGGIFGATVPEALWDNNSKSGQNVVINAGTVYNIGYIQAGAGSINAAQKEQSSAHGGNGGDVEIYADSITNDGVIGPKSCGSSASACEILDVIKGTKPSITANQGGNGGMAFALGGRATGGNGGNIIILGNISAINNGTIHGGSGGNACAPTFKVRYKDCHKLGPFKWGCKMKTKEYPGTAKAGQGGKVTFVASTAIIPDGYLGFPCGDGAADDQSEYVVTIDPSVTVMGAKTKIHGGTVIIYGGENWTLDLKNLSPGAVTAANTIRIAAGSGTTVDLRGLPKGVFVAKKFEIFADTDKILLDKGVKLADLTRHPDKRCYQVCTKYGWKRTGIFKRTWGCVTSKTVCEDQPSQIVTKPAKILYDAALVAQADFKIGGGRELNIPLRLTNASPATDTYTITIKDQKGWKLTLIKAVTLDKLTMKTLTLGGHVPTRPGERNIITITAQSQSDPTVSVKTTITIDVLPTFFTVKKKGNGVGTVVVGKETCNAACSERTIPYVDDTAVVLNAMPTEGSRFARWEYADGRVLIEEEYQAQPDDLIFAVFEKQ